MDCFVGASTGALKSINFKESTFVNRNVVTSLQPKNDEITSMCWADNDESQLLVAQMDKQLKLYDTTSASLKTLFTLHKCGSPVKGVHRMKSGDIVSASQSGEFLVSKSNGKVAKELNAGNGLVVMARNREAEQLYATGGRENPLKVWNLETGDKTFVAKNVRPDSLQLRVPIWETGICFVPGSQNIVTSTGLHQIRLYDPRTQRRPVKELEWLDEPLTALSLCNKEMHVIAGNTRGELGLFDWRHKLSMVCKYKGCAGSVSGIDANLSTGYFASSSIDRFVRLHDLNTRKLVKKVYCKARLNCILLRQSSSVLEDDKNERLEFDENWKTIKKSENDSEISDDDSETDVGGDSGDDDLLWDDLNQNEKKSVKRKTIDINEVDMPKKRLKPGRKVLKRKASKDSGKSLQRKKERGSR